MYWLPTFNDVISVLYAVTAEWTGRAWNYVTLGHGNDEAWWRRFCAALAAIGYDDVLSIEHEDMALPPVEGVAQSVALLRRVMPSA